MQPIRAAGDYPCVLVGARVGLVLGLAACGPSLSAEDGGAGTEDAEGGEGSESGASELTSECVVPEAAQLIFRDGHHEVVDRHQLLDLLSPVAFLEPVGPDALWVYSNPGFVELSRGAAPRDVGQHHVDAAGPPGLFSVDHDFDPSQAVVNRVARSGGSLGPLATIELPEEAWWDEAGGWPPYASLAVDSVRVYVFVAGRAPVGGLHVFDATSAEFVSFVAAPSERPTAHALGVATPLLRDVTGRMLYVRDDGFAYAWLRRQDDDVVIEFDLESLEYRDIYASSELEDFAVTSGFVYATGVDGLVAIERRTRHPTLVAPSADRVLPAEDGVFALERDDETRDWDVQRVDDATLRPRRYATVAANAFDVLSNQLVWSVSCSEPTNDDCGPLTSVDCEFDVTQSVWLL